jgi:DNA-directed RNA polymerase I, II, and III subunit RPABC1
MNADAQNQELMRLFRIRKTVLKMLAKRGYNVLEQTLEATFQSFSDDVARISLENNNCTAREACTINVGKIDDASDVVFVFFSDDEKVRQGGKEGRVEGGNLFD